MNIAFVCFSSSWGGLEMMLVKLAVALKGRGHSITVVAPAGSPIRAYAEQHGLHSLAVTPRFRYLDFGTARKIARELRTFQIDIVVCGLSRDLSSCVLATKIARRSRLVFFQQMQFGLSKKDLFHRWVYGNLSLWITLTETMKEATARNTTVSTDNIHVIPFGVDINRFRPRRYKRSRSRKQFNLPEEGPIAAVVGRFDPQKGQDVFLRALPSVLKRVPSLHPILVGEETRGEEGYLRTLQELIDTLGLKRRVRILPFTNEIPVLLSAIDLLVIPSHSETFGYIAIEAMAMKVPVIGTNAGGLKEIVDDSVTGLLVPPKNAEALAEAMVRLLKDKPLAKRMVEAARLKVEKRYFFRKNVEELERVLTSITDE
ncbi:MAG TPA: glycosyltransferase family 4 protein [Bacteroidota bacterium]|nr:glycosyltransferase family 4 protein [Bacteroidota bacterium]